MQGLVRGLAAKYASLPVTMTAVLCLGMTASGMAAESQVDAAVLDNTAASGTPDGNATKTGRSAKRVKKVNKAKAAGSQVTGPVYKSAPVVFKAPAACSEASARALSEKYGLKLWDVHPFNMGDSILLDRDCIRTKLAEYGFAFIAWDVALSSTNMLNHYTPPHSEQQYFGQKPSGFNTADIFLSYDLSRWGLPDGQLSVIGAKNNTTDAPLWSQNTFSVNQLALYGSAFNRQVEYYIGYIPLNNVFQGNYIGGNVNNPLGAGATNSVLAGATTAPEDTPSVFIKYHVTPELYNSFDVSRSTPGTINPLLGYGNRLAIENYSNPSGLNFRNSNTCVFGFCYPAPRELFVDEIGYKAEAAPGRPYTFVRAQGYYSNTPLYNMSANNGSTTHGGSASILADRQIWQTEPDSPYTAYKGIYIGGTVAWNAEQSSVYNQDYEFRIYSFGLFGRPKDQIAFSFQHLVTSNSFNTLVDTASFCSLQIVCARHALNNYTLSYTANIIPGVYASLGASYSDNPNPVWSPLASSAGSNAYPLATIAPLDIRHSLALQAALVTVF